MREAFKGCEGNDFNVLYIALHALLYLLSTFFDAEKEKILGLNKGNSLIQIGKLQVLLFICKSA